MMQTPFPFLFGAATSAHQVEGNNRLNDWWAWEQSGRVPEKSGMACDQWNRAESDIELLKKLGHTAHRFSIEWSRVEPHDNQWDPHAIQYYKNFVRQLRKCHIEPVVTLHHFTNPVWFAAKGGWEKETNVSYFLRYVDRMIRELECEVTYWVTLNEPMVYLYFGYFVGKWPPGKQDFPLAMKTLWNLLRGHVRAYSIIHDRYRKQNLPKPMVSIAKNMIFFSPYREELWRDRLATWARDKFYNQMVLKALHEGVHFFPGVFCEFLEKDRTLDFIGLNYYSRDRIRYKGFTGADLLGEKVESRHLKLPAIQVNQLGWEISPEGFYQTLKGLKKYELPILVLENGICTDNDAERSSFITEHLESIAKARATGVNIQGYFHWSFLDNFEWAEGFDPHFGIVGYNENNFTRNLKPSAQVLTETCRKIIRQT